MDLLISGIGKSLNRIRVLQGVQFELSRGRILGILGPNGSGKTTLLKILALIMAPDQGVYQINGIDALKFPNELRPKLGYVPQDIALFEDLTALDNLIYWSNPQKPHHKDDYYQILAQFDLSSYAHKRVYTMSGGMKRRLNLAVALLNAPEFLILDEPLVGVDIMQRQSLVMHLRQLAQGGMTQVITSHDANAVIDLIDQVMVIHDGSIRYNHPRAAFLDRCNDLHKSVDDTILQILDQSGGNN